MIGLAAKLTSKGARAAAQDRQVTQQEAEREQVAQERVLDSREPAPAAPVKLRLVPCGSDVPAEPRPSSPNRRPDLWDASGPTPPPSAAA